jgi:hypothetical protein
MSEPMAEVRRSTVSRALTGLEKLAYVFCELWMICILTFWLASEYIGGAVLCMCVIDMAGYGET